MMPSDRRASRVFIGPEAVTSTDMRSQRDCRHHQFPERSWGRSTREGILVAWLRPPVDSVKTRCSIVTGALSATCRKMLESRRTARDDPATIQSKPHQSFHLGARFGKDNTQDAERPRLANGRGHPMSTLTTGTLLERGYTGLARQKMRATGGGDGGVINERARTNL